MSRFSLTANVAAFLAVLAMYSLPGQSAAIADTLAEWSLSGIRASETSNPSASSTSTGVSNANLALGGEIVGADYASSFAGCYFKKDGTFENAVAENEYLEIHFVVDKSHAITLSSLSFALRRVAAGPSNYRWLCVTNNASAFTIGEPVSLTEAYTASSPYSTMLSLADIPELPAGTSVSLRLILWGATSNSKTAYIGFTGTISIAGTIREIENDELTLEDIADRTIYFGESMGEALMVSGYDGDWTAVVSGTNKTISGLCKIEGNLFYYKPSKADIDVSPIEFTITASADGNGGEADSKSFEVAVLSPSVSTSIGKSAFDCYAGDLISIQFVFTGDNGENISTNNPVCTTATDATSSDCFSYSEATATFNYTPAVDDIDTTQSFCITLNVGGECFDCNFTVSVSKKPDFLETFDVAKNHSAYFNPTEIFEGVASSWRGTNFNVSSFTGDYGHGEKTAKFRNSGWIEMAGNKADGAGTISFWHRFANNNNKDAAGIFKVEASKDGGENWVTLAATMEVSAEWRKESVAANLGGLVRVRFTYTGNHEGVSGDNKAAALIDDIEISNYEGEVEPEILPIESPTIYADDEDGVTIAITFAGDSGTQVQKGVTSSLDEELGGVYSLTDGVFSYVPAEDDQLLNGGVIDFTITLTVDGKTATRSFNVTLLKPLAKWLDIGSKRVLKEKFNAIGIDAAAALPPPWRVAHSGDLWATNGVKALSWTNATTATDFSATFGSKRTSGGIYNVGASEEASDRAICMLSSSSTSANGYRTCALIVPLKNTGSTAITGLGVSYTLQKWRTGNAKHLGLFYSRGGENWDWTRLNGFYDITVKADGESNAWFESAEAMAEDGNSRIVKSGTADIEIGVGETVYLGWFYMSDSGNSGSAQAWAIDNIRISHGDKTTMLLVR